jgi:anti-anti-sigma factor
LSSEPREIADGTLEVRTAENGETQVVSLCGELDLANAPTAETALERALRQGRRVIVDMRELEFIDSTGIALLVAALGHDGETELGFVPSSSQAVNRVLELTGLANRLPLVDAP